MGWRATNDGNENDFYAMPFDPGETPVRDCRLFTQVRRGGGLARGLTARPLRRPRWPLVASAPAEEPAV